MCSGPEVLIALVVLALLVYYYNGNIAANSQQLQIICEYSKVESSRTSLASRTHFEVLGLGLEGQVLGLGLETSSPRKLACPRLEDSTIF